MKNIFFILSIVLIIYSCNPSNNETKNIKTIHPNDIQISETIHDSLTTQQIEKIKKIHSTFIEVYPVSLNETIINFKRDQNPDSEIGIWLQMASTYQNYLSAKQGKLELNKKKDVFKLIISRSMMPDKEAITNSKLTILTEEEAKEVLSYYSETPEPIDVVKIP